MKSGTPHLVLGPAWFAIPSLLWIFAVDSLPISRRTNVLYIRELETLWI
jgi:hypothetical protein